MKSNSNILKIIALGFQLFLPSKLKKSWGWFYFICVGLSYALFSFLKVESPKLLLEMVLPVLGIFTALIFSAIFTIPNQLSEKLKDYDDCIDEPTLNFLIRYRNYIVIFSRQLVSLVLYSVIIILLISLTALSKGVIFTRIVYSAIFPLGVVFVVLLFSTINNIYRMIEESIDYSTDKIKLKQKQIDKS